MHRTPFILPLLFLFACTNAPDKLPPVTKDFCSSIHCDDSVTLSQELEPVAELMKTKTGVYVLEDGGTSMIARAWMCEHAEKTIDIQYFIFSTDNVGLIACDYLVRAADRGVKVRILVDDLMVDASEQEILTMDSHENIDVKIYNPGSNLGKNIAGKITKLITDFHSVNQRMHNKTFIVDSKAVITGGRNIVDEYFDYDHEFNFRDRDVFLLGKSTAVIQHSFEEYWTHKLSVPVSNIVECAGKNLTDPDRFGLLHQYACNPENFWPQVRERMKLLPHAFKDIQNSGQLQWLDEVSFIADAPGKNTDRASGMGGITTDSLIMLVKNAKHSVDIQSPYLVTTNLGKTLFRDAVMRGVKVKILTNSLLSNDNLEAFSGYQRDRKELLATGVEIYEFRPDAKERYMIMTGDLQKKLNYAPVFGLHAKTMVIDGHTTVIGTFNLDPRSANLNCECITVIRSNKIAEGVMKGIEEEYKPENSWKITKDFNPDAEAGRKKRISTWMRKAVPKGIL